MVAELGIWLVAGYMPHVSDVLEIVTQLLRNKNPGLQNLQFTSPRRSGLICRSWVLWQSLVT